MCTVIACYNYRAVRNSSVNCKFSVISYVCSCRKYDVNIFACAIRACSWEIREYFSKQTPVRFALLYETVVPNRFEAAKFPASLARNLKHASDWLHIVRVYRKRAVEVSSKLNWYQNIMLQYNVVFAMTLSTDIYCFCKSRYIPYRKIDIDKKSSLMKYIFISVYFYRCDNFGKSKASSFKILPKCLSLYIRTFAQATLIESILALN